MNETHSSIRVVNFNNIKIGGETSFPIFSPVLALNVPIFNPVENFCIAKEFFGSDDRIKILEKAQEACCDILSLKFNLVDCSEVEEAIHLFSTILPNIKKPLMLTVSGKDNVDNILVPKLLKFVDREVIVNSANENTYKDIVPHVISGGHVIVLKSPIDINLAKELNILSSDMGLSLDKILIDTDIGGLGYGFEYGYSIMEKIKLEGLKGDSYLNMPILSMACFESLKTKEARSDDYNESWGKCFDRAKDFELVAASAVMACGANIIVLNYPPNISTIKEMLA